MKNIAVLLLIITTISACRKSSDENLTNRSLYGTWELRTSAGGYPGLGANLNYAPGNGNIMVFVWQKRYYSAEKYNNNTKEDRGSYYVSSNTVSGIKYYDLHIKADGQSERQYGLTIKGNQLRLASIGLGGEAVTVWEKQ